MFAKIVLLTIYLTGVSCMSIQYGVPAYFLEDEADLMNDDIEYVYFGHPQESVYPISRVRRQVHGTANPDGSTDVTGKFPLDGNDKNALSAVVGLEGLKNGGSYGSATAGLALENVKGHGLSLTGKHVPSAGDQLTAAGKVNLLHNDNHDLSATAFASKTIPKNPDFPKTDSYGGSLNYLNKNGHGLSLSGKHTPSISDQFTAAATANLFHNDKHDLSANAFATRTMPNNFPNSNTFGGGLDYTYNNKLGASLGAKHNDLFKRTDYSAMGNLNLYRSPTSSLDFSGGVSKSVSPYMRSQSWQPSGAFIYRNYF